MINMQGKVALVTGGSQGLGRAIALELVSLGANVVVADLKNALTNDKLDKAGLLNDKVMAIPLDVTDTNSIEACIREAITRFSCIDILVNNAGVSQQSTWLETTLEDFDNSYNVNVKGIWSMTKAFVPHCRQNGGGKIINIASVAGRGGSPMMPAYNASKAAVINLTQSLARTLGADNINVNAVCPGLTRTPLVDDFLARESHHSGHPDSTFTEEDFIQQVKESSPLSRMITPDDVAHAVAFLASGEAKNITGQALNVDCGSCMS